MSSEWDKEGRTYTTGYDYCTSSALVTRSIRLAKRETEIQHQNLTVR